MSPTKSSTGQTELIRAVTNPDPEPKTTLRWLGVLLFTFVLTWQSKVHIFAIHEPLADHTWKEFGIEFIPVIVLLTIVIFLVHLPAGMWLILRGERFVLFFVPARFLKKES